MSNTIMRNQLKLYQKLNSALPQINNNNESITIYYSKKKKIWFAKSENYNKFYYYFGLKDDLDINSTKLIIDIDKKNEYDPDTMGWLVESPNGIKLLLNLDILTDKYPNINIKGFKKYNVKSGKILRNYIDLSYIDSNKFIKNIEKLVQNSHQLKQKEKTQKITPDICSICGDKNKSGNSHFQVKKIYNKIRPDFCGNCLEKIITCEFYDKVKPFITSNETRTLKISREKYSNEKEFDLGIRLLEKYDIIRYVGIKKLYFSIDKNNSILKEYSKYITGDDYFIDNIYSNKDEMTNSEKQMRINLFINSLEAGKSKNDALKISGLDNDQLEAWYESGKKGDSYYREFYEKYDKYRIPNTEMNNFIKTLKKDKNLENALNKTGLSLDSVKKWYDLGKNNHPQYRYFYRQCVKLLPDGFVIKSDEDLMNEFIQLRNDGKSNKQAIRELKISDEKVKLWINKGNLGDEKYSDFYNSYADKKKVSCEICGRKINKKNTSGICKRCAKKQFASKIVIKLLKYFTAGEEFKKEDLNVLNLQDMQITEYLWTLKEFNLIEQKNNKYSLISQDKLEEFIKSSGIDVGEIPHEKSKKELYRTCDKCGESLLIKSNFSMNEKTCKKCKKLTSTAKYLIELLNYVEFGEEFSEDDLEKHYGNLFKLQAKLWALTDNDLVKKNLDNNTYTLADRQKITGFIDKYSNSKFELPKKNNIENTDETDDNDGILKLIPEEIEKTLMRRSRGNKTGFAWVNKNGNFYTYSRSFNGKKIEIKDRDIYKLYEKVTAEDLLWGVRDLKKATAIVKPTDSNMFDPEIYAPVPEKYMKKFNSANKTGIAWVNKNGDSFIYSRSVKGKHYYFREPTIEKLFLKVKSNNQIWGIRDYSKASRYIPIPDNFKIEDHIKSKPEEDEKISAPEKGKINSPLSEEYMTKDLVKNSPYGIAWVSKKGKRWIYNRKNDNKIIRLSADTIDQLYEKVIENNAVWGITDAVKADKIFNPKSETKTKTKTQKRKSKVKSKINVTYLDKNRKITEILIKGKIKNNELLDVINELKIFELNIKRIITTAVGNNTDLFIELELPKSAVNLFERNIEKSGWNII